MLETFVYYFIELLILALVLRLLIYNLYLWQFKDYRWDRMKAHFEDVGKFYELWFPAKLIFPKKGTLKIYLILATFIILSIIFFLLFGISLGIVISYYLLSPALIALAVFCSNIPANLVKNTKYKKAGVKLAAMKNLKVIGITGSYGKSSMRNFVYKILSEKFKTDMAGFNTEIGVADYILKNLKDDAEIFVVEMGTYKRGEIKAICAYTKPKFAVLTGINKQHLSMMGSLKNIKKAKFELVEALPSDGIVFYNSDNENVCDVMKNWSGKKIPYSLGEVSDIKESLEKTEFVYKNQNFSANILGSFSALNLLGAIKVAEEFGMSLPEIEKAVAKIEAPAETMKLETSSSGIKIINDAYNANPTGVIAAFDFVSRNWPNKKILVMSEMAELGKASPEIYKKVVARALEIFDRIIFLSPKYKQFLTSTEKVLISSDPARILPELRKHLGDNPIILLERVKNKELIEGIRGL